MLPTHNSYFQTHTHLIPEYLRRIIQYPQMDVEFTFWQMFYLCVRPSIVYRKTSWHKQISNQWARDDPGFVAIQIFFLAVSSLAFAVAFRAENLLNLLKIMFSTILIDFLTVGILIATIGWWASNTYLRVVNGIHSVDQKVEWLYAFDIHCNSFFPLFLILYVAQYFLLPVVLGGGFFSTFLANTMYVIAFSYYFHLTFLGYSALPFLQHTIYFIYPIGLVIITYLVTLFSNFNLAIFVMNLYFARPDSNSVPQ